jgi:hypothetical protein
MASNDVVADRNIRLPMFDAGIKVADFLRFNTGGHRGVF